MLENPARLLSPTIQRFRRLRGIAPGTWIVSTVLRAGLTIAQMFKYTCQACIYVNFIAFLEGRALTACSAVPVAEIIYATGFSSAFRIVAQHGVPGQSW